MFSFLKQKKKHPEGLIPRIRPAWWFESYNLEACAIGKLEPKYFFGISDVFFGQYEADLVVGFCIDRDKAVDIVRNCDVKEWELSYEELLEIAKDNLLKRKPYFSKIRDGIWASTLSNTCDSALMLFKDEILELDLVGNPIVFFLTRDCLLVTGSNDEVGKFFCMETMMDNMRNRDYLTSNTYALINGEWQHAMLNGEHEHFKEYRYLLLHEIKLDTNEFLENLETLHVDVSDDFHISRMGVGNKDNNDFTYAPWIETEKNWIPKVDCIILGPLENRDANEEQIAAMLDELTFDWEVVAQVCSSNMKQLDFFHEIWEFQGFPTEVKIEKMKTLRAQKAK